MWDPGVLCKITESQFKDREWNHLNEDNAFKNIFISFYVLPANMYVYHVPMEARRRCWLLWTWRYRWLRVEIKLMFSARATISPIPQSHPLHKSLSHTGTLVFLEWSNRSHSCSVYSPTLSIRMGVKSWALRAGLHARRREGKGCLVQRGCWWHMVGHGSAYVLTFLLSHGSSQNTQPWTLRIQLYLASSVLLKLCRAKAVTVST